MWKQLHGQRKIFTVHKKIPATLKPLELLAMRCDIFFFLAQEHSYLRSIKHCKKCIKLKIIIKDIKQR